MSLVVFLLLIGLITLASASQQNINLIGNQILNILIGMVLLISIKPYRSETFPFLCSIPIYSKFNSIITCCFFWI